MKSEVGMGDAESSDGSLVPPEEGSPFAPGPALAASSGNASGAGNGTGPVIPVMVPEATKIISEEVMAGDIVF